MTGDEGAAVGGDGNFTLRIMNSRRLESLSLAHLGDPLLTIDEPRAELEFEREIRGIKVPAEGIEFWVEGAFMGTPDGNHRPAISFELIPEHREREPLTVTLWGQPSDSKIEAPAVFLWPQDLDKR